MRTVTTVKSLLSKRQSIYSSPCLQGFTTIGVYSPAEMLIRKMLNTTLTVHLDSVMSKRPNGKFKAKNKLYNEKMKMNCDINPEG